MTTPVQLTPELERFAQECVASGGYHDVSEVVRAGLRMLQEAEDRQRQFLASLREAAAEADRDGTIPIDRAVHEARAAIRAKRK